MNIHQKILASAVALGLTATASTAMADTTRFVVDLKNNANIDDVLVALQDTAGIDIVRILDELNAIAVEVDTANIGDLSALRARNDIAGYAPDVKRYLSEEIPEDWDPMTLEIDPYGIGQVNATSVQFDGDAGISVCIIDSGYALGHPDLPNGDGVTGHSEGAGPWSQDGNSHGTHVSGTIAALDNGMGVTGVIPTGDVQIHMVRVFNDDGGWVYASDLAGAIEECASVGADVVNMSLGSSLESNIERRAMARANRKGLLLVAAAGNDGVAMHHYPASYDDVVSVAATDIDEIQANFSQWNSGVEISGPGVDTLSTHPEGWQVKSGTSMATPHVTGVAALVWSNHPECSNTEIRMALNASAKDLGEAGYDYQTGWGLVQADAADAWLDANACKGNGKGRK